MRLRAITIFAGAMLLVALCAAVAAGASSPRTSDFIPSDQEETPSCDPLLDFDPGNFPSKPTSYNKWLPLEKNTQFVLEGRSNRGGGPLPHTITSTVTDLTKVIDGVRTRVIWDVDSNQGTVQESELAFFAEDYDGNVWLFGEYPEEYDGGVFKGAPNTWLGGLADAEPGVQVPSQLRLTGPSYRQALAPEVGFFDCAKDIIKGESACVPIGCFDGVAVVEEWSPLDPGAFQRKFYAPWVGNISIGAVNDPEGETLVLADRKKLGLTAAKVVRAEALKLDERAYLVSDVYRETDPAKPGGIRPEIPPPGTPAVAPTFAPPILPIPGAAQTTSKPRKKAKRCSSKHRRRGAKRKRCSAKPKRCASKKGYGAGKRKRCVAKKRAHRRSSR
jgi:hypothetical protein